MSSSAKIHAAHAAWVAAGYRRVTPPGAVFSHSAKTTLWAAPNGDVTVDPALHMRDAA